MDSAPETVSWSSICKNPNSVIIRRRRSPADWEERERERVILDGKRLTRPSFERMAIGSYSSHYHYSILRSVRVM